MKVCYFFRFRASILVVFLTMLLIAGCSETADEPNTVKGRLIDEANQPLEEVTLQLIRVPSHDEKTEIASSGIKRVSYIVSGNEIILDSDTVYDRYDNLFLVTEYRTITDTEGNFIFKDLDPGKYYPPRFSIFVRLYEPPPVTSDPAAIAAHQILYDKSAAVSFVLKDNESIDLGELVFPSY